MSSMHPNPSNEKKPEVENPSDDEIAQVSISGIVFATSEDLDDSLKESKKKTEIWTLTSRLESIERMTPIPILKGANWNHCGIP
ncbi:hypothetical protein K3495_g3890 [Podosphaera aphanis]|nr:hypothetical protein K3495_g3890 [Podosphaera aphanis]